MIKTLLLMLIRVTLLPFILVCTGFFKLFKLGIYTGSFIMLSIGRVCFTGDSWVYYKNNRLTKALSELLGFAITVIIIIYGLKLIF